MKITPEILQNAMFEQFKSGEVFDTALELGKTYLQNICDRNVAPASVAQINLSRLDEPLPEKIGIPDDIIALLNNIGSPATMAQAGGRFFGLVNGSIIPTSLAARIMGDSWDQNAVLHVVSPANAKIEEVCQNWIIQLLGLPPQTVAGFVSGTSMALVSCLAAARYRLFADQDWDINRKGLNGAPSIRIVAGRHVHSTVLKAIALLGFGTDCVEWVDVDEQGRLITAKLPKLDSNTILILQAGNVNSGAFDPIRDCCEIARRAGAWVHIDGAFGLWAAACDKLKHLTDGLELANSWSVDGHKTLNTPYDCGMSLCADPEALVKALQNTGAYITYSENRDGMLYTPEMSRRARAIDLWGALKYLGREGVDALILGLHKRAQQFSQELKIADFEVLNDIVFNQILVKVGDEAKTKAFVDHIQKSGECWVGTSEWFSQPVIRISVCSWATTKADVTRSVQAFVDAKKSTLTKKEFL